MSHKRYIQHAIGNNEATITLSYLTYSLFHELLIMRRLYQECKYIQIYSLSDFQIQQPPLTLLWYIMTLNLCLNNWNSWSFSISLPSQPRPPASGENHFILLTFTFSLSDKIMHTNLNLSILLRQPMYTRWKFLVITSANRKTRIPRYIRTHKYLSVWRETSLSMSKQEFKTWIPSICFISSIHCNGKGHRIPVLYLWTHVQRIVSS